MASIDVTGSLTFDESAGLQNSLSTPSVSGDATDNDVAVSTLPSTLTGRLFALLGDTWDDFATLNGAGASATDFVKVSGATGTITSLGFVDGSGDALPIYGVDSSGAPTGLTTLDGEAISLFADSSLGDDLVLGVDASGDIVFAIYMSPTNLSLSSAQVWVVQFQPLYNPDATNPDDPVDLSGYLDVAASTAMDFNFNALPSGQNLFGVVGDVNSGLIVIGKAPVLNADGTFTNTSNTINTSKGGGPTTIGVNNQMFDAVGEGAYFTFVKSPVPNYLSGVTGGLDQNEADDADNIQYTGGMLEVHTAYVKISQLQGNSLATIKVTAFDVAGSPQGQAFVAALGTNSVAIDPTTVMVYDQNGNLIGWNEAGYNGPVHVTDAGGGAIQVSGLGAGYKVVWTTAEVHDQVLVENVAGKFDIGGFGTTESNLITTDIGAHLVFEDDGPTASLTKTSATVTVDETAGLQNASSADAGDKDDSEVASSTLFGGATLATVFTVASASTDLTAQYAMSATALVTPSSSYGTDAAHGTTSLSLGLNLQDFTGQSATVGSATETAVLTDLTTTDGHAIWLVKEGDLIVGRVQTSASGVPLVLGDAALAIAIDTTGKVATVQYASLTHPDGYSYDEAVDLQATGGQSYVLAVLSVKDGDNDPATDSKGIGDQLRFEDDGPSATLVSSGATVTVDETLGLQNASSVDAGDQNDNEVLGSATVFNGATALTSVFAGVSSKSTDLAAQYAFSGAALVSSTGSAYGADGEGGATSYSLALNTSNFSGVTVTGGGSGTAILTDLTTTDGEKIWLVKEGDVIVGRVQTSADGAPLTLGVAAFALAIDASGKVATAQYESLAHLNTSSSDESVDLSNVNSYVNAVLTVTDGDHDVKTLSVGIGSQVLFEDDGPTIGPVSDGLVNFAAGSSVTNPLNGDTGSDQKTAPYEITSFQSTLVVNGVTLTGVLSTDKHQVDYIVDTNHNGLVDTGEETYFRLSLNENGGGSYTFDVLKNPPPTSIDFSFDKLPSGQNLFGVVGSAETALIVIGEHPVLNADGTFSNVSDTINTSKGGGPTTIGVNNQMFDPGDGAYFTFVKNPAPSYLSGAPGGLDQNEADDADNIQYGDTLEVNSAYVKISQIQGNSLATMKITAYDLSTDPQARDFVAAAGTGAHVDIIESSVKVYDKAGNEIKWYDASYHGPVTVTDSGGSTVVTGLGAGYKVVWDTAAPSDQVLIENVAGKFDIGGFGSTQATPTPDLSLDFTAQVTDGDGDHMLSNTFQIGIDGTGIYDDNHVSGVDAYLV